MTASDSSHEKSLIKFVETVKKYEPSAKLIIYDLGLSDHVVKYISEISPNTLIKKFEYYRYPSWFNIKINAGEYAWKPVIVYEVVSKAHGPVVWMDAGNRIKSKLNHVYGRVLRSGFYSTTTQGDLSDWTHEGTLKYFNLSRDWARGKKNVNGAIVAFNPLHKKALNVSAEWNRLAQIKDAIAPEGSSRKNHRQDQALLGVLCHRENLVSKYPEQCSEFRIHCDID